MASEDGAGEVWGISRWGKG